MLVWFPAYRDFDRARVAANDASVALMLGGALAGRDLEGQDDRRLPELFSDIPDIERLDVTVARARLLLDESDRYLAYMAIPFVLSVHGTFLADVLGMLADDGFDIGPRDPNERAIADLHADVMQHCRRSLTPEEEADFEQYLSLFQFVRALRTRIVHSGGATGDRVRRHWNALPRASRQHWERVAGRPFDTERGRPLDLGRGEMILALSLSKRLADHVNHSVVRTLSRGFWAREVVRDYAEQNPVRYRQQRDRLLNHLFGHARFAYRAIGLRREEIEAALAETSAASERSGGSAD
jgi:hypothetical protein